VKIVDDPDFASNSIQHKLTTVGPPPNGCRYVFNHEKKEVETVKMLTKRTGNRKLGKRAEGRFEENNHNQPIRSRHSRANQSSKSACSSMMSPTITTTNSNRRATAAVTASPKTAKNESKEINTIKANSVVTNLKSPMASSTSVKKQKSREEDEEKASAPQALPMEDEFGQSDGDACGGYPKGTVGGGRRSTRDDPPHLKRPRGAFSTLESGELDGEQSQKRRKASSGSSQPCDKKENRILQMSPGKNSSKREDSAISMRANKPPPRSLSFSSTIVRESKTKALMEKKDVVDYDCHRQLDLNGLCN
jgi:hypothetical protein